MQYVAYLHKEKTSDYGVSFPDFPGCVTAGRSLDEARNLASRALTLHVRGMVVDGELIPAPSKLDELANDPALHGAITFQVALHPPEQSST
jgi:predicted RNase H-like HicB family nuclease